MRLQTTRGGFFTKPAPTWQGSSCGTGSQIVPAELGRRPARQAQQGDGLGTAFLAAAALHGTKFGSKLINALPSSDATARPSFPGERHMILKLPNGKNGGANYMGPGTEIIKRLKRGDPGRTPADKVAKMHDINYALAANAPTKQKQQKAVRAADNRMIASLKKMQTEKADASRNIQAGLKGIQSKVVGEDFGLLNKGSFSGPLEKVSTADNRLLQNNKNELEQQGLGIEPEPLPGQLLKERMLKKFAKPGPAGGGVSLAGGGLTKTVIDVIMPEVLKDLRIKKLYLPKALITKLVKKATINKTGKPLTAIKLKDICNKLGKHILPAMCKAKLKTMGQSGSGIYMKAAAKLHPKFAEAMHIVLKNHQKGMSGSGFFSSIGKAFKKVKHGFTKAFHKVGKFVHKNKAIISPLLNVGGIAATALGQPELGLAAEVADAAL
jgi:hypothetical protein